MSFMDFDLKIKSVSEKIFKAFVYKEEIPLPKYTNNVWFKTYYRVIFKYPKIYLEIFSLRSLRHAGT